MTWDGFSFDRSSPRLVNCISWGNGFNLWTYGGWGESSPSITHSNIEEGFEGEGNIAEDLLFVAGDDGILFLSAGSPCIDAGRNPVACSSLDVGGDERIVGRNIDMGAYEFGNLRAIPPANRKAVEGISYKASLHATGGRPPYTWQRIDPADMILSSGGELSWQPSEYGRRTISALLTDSQGSQQTLAFALEVARPIYVDCSAAESGDGSSLQQAFRTIGEALDVASPGEAVVVAPGTYGESVRLKYGVDVISLSGPEATSIICPDTGRGTAAVLFGELSDSLSGSSSAASIANALRDGDVSLDAPTFSSPRVEGFTLKGGWAGVIFAGRSAEIFNCIISGEQSGFYCRDAQGRLDKSIISNSDWGIACTSGEPRVTRSIITGCRLGVYADPGSPLLRNCVIAGNFWSGIEFAEASCPVAIDCILWDNVSDLSETGGSVQVRRSIVKDYFFTETNGNAFIDPLFVARGDFSREIWVNPNYPQGDSDGTWEKPYASISAALASLPSYDYHLSAASPCLKANGSSRDKGAFPGEPPAASPDSSNIVIHLAPGTYKEGPILLQGHITLSGAGVVQTVMEPPEVEYWHDYVLVAGNGSLISDVCVSGSGMSFAGSDVTISDCFVTRFVCISHDPLILRCKASGGGGSGFYVSGGSPTILNCLACDSGTGMEFDNSSAEVINCTVSSNKQGVVCFNYGGRAPSFRNCIIWGNWVDIPTPDHGQMVPIFSYCDIRHGWPGRGNIGSDPLFIPGSGCRLSSNSPCIDAGDPASDYSMEPQPNGGRINMGAYGNTIYAQTSITVDKDNDGIRDDWELQNFNTLDFDPMGDTDSDGLTEYQEHLFRTNPFLPDSDGDGYSDATEVAEGTDPADPGDPFRITGMSRGEGIVQITYPVVPGYRYWVWSTENLRGEWQRSTVSYYCNVPEAPRTQELESLQHKKHFIKVEKAFP
ncbi:MAG: right-handed parallel beta-helix repeat-containing protein [bacterium]|nr:right-handed parallel beta-helix repeat-containing protein [bacterium]